jgi:hypothetical protein
MGIVLGACSSTTPRSVAMTVHPTPAPGTQSNGRVVAVVFVAVAMQIAVAVPFTTAVGLLAPAWGVATAWSLWLASAAALFVTTRRRPLLTPAVPILNAALLFALIAIGESFLGWTG